MDILQARTFQYLLHGKASLSIDQLTLYPFICSDISIGHQVKLFLIIFREVVIQSTKEGQFVRPVPCQHVDKIVRSEFIFVKGSLKSRLTCNQNMTMIGVKFTKSQRSSISTLLRSTKYKWNLVISNYLFNLLANLSNRPFRCSLIPSILYLHISIISHLHPFNTNTILRVHQRTHLGKEPPQTTWPIFLSTFVNGSFSCKIERSPHNHYLSILPLSHESTQPWVIIYHRSV